MEDNKKSKNRNKGTFVGGYLTNDQIEKIQAVEKLYDEQFGDAGRNRTRAIRFIIDSFDPAWLNKFPKDLELIEEVKCSQPKLERPAEVPA